MQNLGVSFNKSSVRDVRYIKISQKVAPLLPDVHTHGLATLPPWHGIGGRIPSRDPVRSLCGMHSPGYLLKTSIDLLKAFGPVAHPSCENHIMNDPLFTHTLTEHSSSTTGSTSTFSLLRTQISFFLTQIHIFQLKQSILN